MVGQPLNSLAALTERLRTLERRWDAVEGAAQDQTALLCPTGWTEIDVALGGGLRAGLHEWFGVAAPAFHASRVWTPALAPLVHMVHQTRRGALGNRFIVWVGTCCFPYGAALAARNVLACSIFVAAESPADRVWTVDLALRCPAVGVVVADGSRFDMAATRRVQLVAESRGLWALLARPPCETADLSAARTRWLVRWMPPAAGADAQRPTPRWSVELLRCKGMPLDVQTCSWVLEWDHEQDVVRLSAPLAGATGEAQLSARLGA